ncbi:hypothetical protein NP493_263g01020 [Ridgeia piscesae]|uniref:Uncharacterized protein n=1 Tax=Ridgeia piscesae TaxID=27915 RepID=A0AAD9UCL4_RIDPI|nr:hypothetical protein NP493_263g01020 [Ridgeia piscesae]
MKVLRPNTAMGCRSPDNMGYVDGDTGLGYHNTLLGPGIRDRLVQYYDKAPAEDKARCLELLTALDLGDVIKIQAKDLNLAKHCVTSNVARRKQRPRTAMAFRDYERLEPENKTSVYKTSYQRDYPQLPSDHYTAAIRPESAGVLYPRRLPARVPRATTTTYSTEYYHKPERRQMPYVGAESGNTDDHRNNPHPQQKFIWWRYPTRPAYDVNGLLPSATDLTDEAFDKVIRGKLRSTYQCDFKGMPQGERDPSVLLSSASRRQRAPHTLDTFTRQTYTRPRLLPEELRAPTDRYGSNKNKQMASVGAGGPTGTTIYRHLKTTTTYDNEYRDINDAIPVRHLARQYGGEALQRYATIATEEREKHELSRMLRAIGTDPATSPPPTAISIRHSMKFRPAQPW